MILKNEKESKDLLLKEKDARGGAREGAGRKPKFGEPLKIQIRVTKTEKDFLLYARKNNFDFVKNMQKKNQSFALPPKNEIRKKNYNKTMQPFSAEKIRKIFCRFEKQNPAPAPELKFKNAYTLLVSVVLSAQATDKSVNRATEPLYKIADSPKKMLSLGEKNLASYIKSIGLYNAKAKNVIALSRMLLENFGGKVPATCEELMTLPGVGRKSANVVLNVIFGKPAMPVDTHVFRVAKKIGLASGKTPLQVEQELLSCVPKKYLGRAHHWLLLHGRYVCTAKNPKCGECVISDLCLQNDAALKM